MSKDLYIIVTSTRTIVSTIISWFTRAPYNHASVSFDKQLEEMYSFCRYYRYFPIPAGFSHEHVNTCVFGTRKNIPCEVYRLKIDDEDYAKSKKMVAEMLEDGHYLFNLLGFATILMKRDTRRDHRFFCSQFVAYLLSNSHVKLNTVVNLTAPEDLRHLEAAQLVFKGNLRDYYDETKAKSSADNLKLADACL